MRWSNTFVEHIFSEKEKYTFKDNWAFQCAVISLLWCIDYNTQYSITCLFNHKKQPSHPFVRAAQFPEKHSFRETDQPRTARVAKRQMDESLTGLCVCRLRACQSSVRVHHPGSCGPSGHFKGIICFLQIPLIFFIYKKQTKQWLTGNDWRSKEPAQIFTPAPQCLLLLQVLLSVFLPPLWTL